MMNSSMINTLSESNCCKTKKENLENSKNKMMHHIQGNNNRIYS